MIILTAFLLGIVHGITPDEHTWPITFSYAIGSYSTRRGLLSGLAFSGAFTVQRALACVLAYVALGRWLQGDRVNGIIYLCVGLAMAAAGAYVLRLGRAFHLHLLPPFVRRFAQRTQAIGGEASPSRPVRPWMAALHGFIAGWGVGAFAAILYTTLAPSMPSLATSWLPGASFGLGTMLTQASAGALFGWWMRHRRLPEQAIALVARHVAGTTLWWGGIAFAVAGIVSLVAPQVAAWQVATPLQVHNLDQLNLGVLLVALVVLGIGGGAMIQAMREASRKWPLLPDVQRVAAQR
ncbi:MAG TPA: hypothetical protein VIU62_20450 [Chloroflexota bacterium]